VSIWINPFFESFPARQSSLQTFSSKPSLQTRSLSLPFNPSFQAFPFIFLSSIPFKPFLQAALSKDPFTPSFFETI